MWFSVFPWKKDKVFSYFFVTEMNTLPRWLFVLEEYIGKLNLHIQTDFSFNTFHVFSAFCSRISLTLACPMDLRLYPLDKQVCVLQIASCKYTILFERLILRHPAK